MASILNANNFYPKECTLFEKRLCFKPKYIHFVYSFLAYVAFSSCLRREDQFVVAVLVFFLTRSTRTCRCHSKWSFFGSSVFLAVKNPYNLTSQIRFCILPKKRTLRLLTGGLSWGTQSVFARGVPSSLHSCRRQEDPADKVGHFMWTYIETLLWDNGGVGLISILS